MLGHQKGDDYGYHWMMNRVTFYVAISRASMSASGTDESLYKRCDLWPEVPAAIMLLVRAARMQRGSNSPALRQP